MFLLDNTVVVSASDITQAGQCEFAFLRRLDVKLGRDVIVPPLADAMLERAASLGDEHEARQLISYRAQYGEDRVLEIDRPDPFTREGIELRAQETAEALGSSTLDIIFQATFFDPELRMARHPDEPTIGFIGFADFLQTRPGDSGLQWEVQDTKLARKARVAALLQLAAYGEQIERVGATPATHGVLILGDGSRSVHRLSDIAPVYRSRRARLIDIVIAGWQRDAVTPWGDAETFACGRCEVCEPEVLRTRDPLLVAGIRAGQRDRLLQAGIHTIDALAELDAAREVPGLTRTILDKLRDQASVQVASETQGMPAVRVVQPGELAAIPEPSEGDLFFDFEGDPMHREQSPGGHPVWGLDYLFGMIDTNEKFTPLWAHSLAEEKQALCDFLALVAERRREFPDMHIYHYAPYERTHLLSIAARHGVGEREVDDLLRDHVLVDLYPIVRKTLKVGSRSYSIKKLEPLYMGDELRDEDGVVSGAQSVTEYAEAARLKSLEDPEARAEGEARLHAIADYNRYDCVSTLRLRDWLLGIAREHGVAAAIQTPDGETGPSIEVEVSPTAERLMLLADESSDESDAQSLRLAASAIDYHQREQKSFWWSHFARLSDPIEDWADTRDVLIPEPQWCAVIESWHTPPRARKPRRHVELRGHMAPGSSWKPGQKVFALYDQPLPYPQAFIQPGMRGAREVTVLDRYDDAIVIEEMLPDGASEWHEFPVALTPGKPPQAGSQKGAIEEWGEKILNGHEHGADVSDPVFDLMRRKPPRLIGIDKPIRADDDEALSAVNGNEEARTIGAVTATLRRLDRSYLAVQGPPGTGKTYLASHVIKRLVEEDGWRIGVVAQSHKVVENVLEGIIAAGLDASCVAKVPQGGALDPEHPTPNWTVLRNNGHQAFLSDDSRKWRGAVIGGTAWDFSNTARVDRGELDLLVIDEAGQFSLAPTIAAGVAAERLLLLGDPQQLPQVSQGSHPEPVDTSALGWLIDTHDTLPNTLGYFLETTRRMHPALADIDSRLSYEGRLYAHPSAEKRIVEGEGAAGLAWHPVEHRGNSTQSVEEAEVVVDIVRQELGRSLREAGTPERPLTTDDIIVVAAYNAQVECVSETLSAAGITGVRVGTVDKFQGQEAVIAVVTLAASSPSDVPRGLDFLLMRNRLNVAISRAQWSAHLVSSRWLGGVGLPASAAEVSALSGYLFLTESAHLAGPRREGVR